MTVVRYQNPNTYINSTSKLWFYTIIVAVLISVIVAYMGYNPFIILGVTTFIFVTYHMYRSNVHHRDIEVVNHLVTFACSMGQTETDEDGVKYLALLAGDGSSVYMCAVNGRLEILQCDVKPRDPVLFYSHLFTRLRIEAPVAKIIYDGDWLSIQTKD